MDSTKEIQSFVTRGIENVFPSREALAAALSRAHAEGKRLTIYLGIDPTGPTLHISHAIPLMKLGALQKMGHRIILLMGDFTAMIGDPTDKMAARKQLTRKEVLNNLKLYKKQASVFLSFSGRNKAEIKYNSKWLGKMSFEDVVRLASNMTVDQMLKRDMFRARMDAGKPVYLHEFLYPLMQGYDSVAMDVDAEIGGNDQTFNMLAGRDLMRSLRDKEKFVIATKLLVDPTGKKMGKTEGNMITLADEPADMFGKVMSWSDPLIIPGFELCTRASDAEIAADRALLDGGANPRDSKAKLAHAIVELYRGREAADKAHESFFSAFSKGGMPDDVPMAAVAKGASLADTLVAHQIVSSKTEFRRLLTEGAIKDLASGRQLGPEDQLVSSDLDLKIGKHRFLKIRAK